MSHDLPCKSFLPSQAVHLFIFCALCALAGCAPYGLPRDGEKVYRNVVFARPEGRPLSMDIYVPESSKPVPVVVWIFGGSWKFGDKGYHLNLRNLTRYGIAVASIQYRLSNTAKYPAQLQDCEASIEWLRKNGGRYAIDPTRIGVSGESAGGHLAALTGLVESTPRIRGVCVLYPVTDLVALTKAYHKQYDYTDMERLLGGRLADRMALAKDGSPVNHVSAFSPPFLIFHGAKDHLVPLAESKNLEARLKTAKVPVHLEVVPDKGHWFQLTPEQVAETADFFHKCFAVTR